MWSGSGWRSSMRTPSKVQLSSALLCQCLNAIITRWHRLIKIDRNPYRPELHYMRGPGPKWYAKHQGRTKNGPL